MLRFLAIRHLAVIDHLEAEFEPGLTILTGETGAGKSILIEALDLLMGGRASADLVRTGHETASIQAVFDHPDGREVIVRREISTLGRSRAFIDDALATSGALRDLGTSLLNLHGQHEHETLLDPARHVMLLDGFGALDERVDETAACFEAWRAATAALERTRLDEREKRARIEMARFQLDEIARVGPAEHEDDQLDTERAVLGNAERLSRLSQDAFSALYDGDQAALVSLATTWKRLEELAAIDPQFQPYLDQREDVKSQLTDLAFALRDYSASIDAAPERLQAVEDRRAAIERLKKKYGPSLDQVRQRQQALLDELAALDASDEHASALAATERETRASYLRAARALSAARQQSAGRLGVALEADLSSLAMPNAKVQVRVEDLSQSDDWTRNGIDRVEFYLSPNPGEDLRPLARIASGGELSRLMLALRSLSASDQPGRTLIFDEVDAGIGGEAADAVGQRLQALASRYQVLCITHLAQIAARAATHFQVSKFVQKGRTLTRLTRLDESGREAELARMIAGAEVTPKVLASARELLQKRIGEQMTKPVERKRKAKAKGRPGA